MSQNKRFGIIKKYYSYRAVPARPEIREKRAKRQNVTKETQAAVNRRLRAEKLSRLIVDNYEAGDLYLTCTCREHMTAEDIHKAFDEQFKRRLRALYKRAAVVHMDTFSSRHLDENGLRKYGEHGGMAMWKSGSMAGISQMRKSSQNISRKKKLKRSRDEFSRVKTLSEQSRKKNE